MEIEVKFRVTSPLGASEIEAVDLSPYYLGAGSARELHDTLLDTADLSLARQKYALRLRYQDGRPLLTLKGPPEGEGNLHRRREWEAVIHSDTPLQPSAWPSSIANQIEELVEVMDLEPILWVENQRHAWALFRGRHRLGELVLDRGKIRSREKEIPLLEIEIELASQGTEADLEAIGGRLSIQLPLEPEHRSKLERGLALLDRSR